MEKLLLFVSGALNVFQVCFYALSSKLGFKKALPIKVIPDRMARIGIKMTCVALEQFCFCFVVLLAFFLTPAL